jgi:hypothetical protein
MPQTKAVTVPEHNVPVRENMSRGSYKKLAHATRHKDGYSPGDSLGVLPGG